MDENKTNDNDPLLVGLENYQKFASTINATCPIHKINFNLENNNAIAGMYLVVMEDPKSYLNKIVDKKDLNDNTLLVFQSRHVVECCQIIYGCIRILDGVKMAKVSAEYVINKLITALLTTPIFYYSFTLEIGNIINAAVINPKSDVEIATYNKFKSIMENIWFVPYAGIDNIAKEAIEEFKKECENGDKNE